MSEFFSGQTPVFLANKEKIEKKENLSFSNYTASDKMYSVTWVNKMYDLGATIGDKFDGIFQGLATSKDALYIVKKVNGVFEVPQSGRTYQLEPEFFKPFLMGKDVQRYAGLKSEKYVFFPYRITQSGAEIVPISEIEKQYPQTYQYIKDHECSGTVKLATNLEVIYDVTSDKKVINEQTYKAHIQR